MKRKSKQEEYLKDPKIVRDQRKCPFQKNLSLINQLNLRMSKRMQIAKSKVQSKHRLKKIRKKKPPPRKSTYRNSKQSKRKKLKRNTSKNP